MIFVDFSDYGLEDSMPIDPEELRLINQGAHRMFAEYTEHSLRELVDQWEVALMWRAIESEPVDDEWFTRALLCIAIMGYLGERRPKFFDINDLG